jgi:hypothetical protein
MAARSAVNVSVETGLILRKKFHSGVSGITPFIDSNRIDGSRLSVAHEFSASF